MKTPLKLNHLNIKKLGKAPAILIRCYCLFGVYLLYY